MEKLSIERKNPRAAPGLRNLLGYRREWLQHDAVAGVSVAAVALPTAIAYAELIGFEPVVRAVFQAARAGDGFLPPRHQMVHRGWQYDQQRRQYRRSCPGSIIGGPAHAGDSARLCQPPNRGSRLAGTLRSTGGNRRWRTFSDPQISCGCLRLRRLCRDVGNGNRTIVGSRTRWIPSFPQCVSAPLPFG